MSMEEVIFLSASVPDSKRAPDFAESASSVAIASAVRALVHVVLGRRILVWGGHPAITPMIKFVAEEMGIDYGKWVKLYQSLYFEEQFPQDNEVFKNIVYTPNINNDLKQSLLCMREQMFDENNFKSAIFIGGMNGIIDEYTLFKLRHPKKEVVPVLSTGGATLKLAEFMNIPLESELYNNLDYVNLFHNQLGISTKEERFPNPSLQPAKLQDRYWKPT